MPTTLKAARRRVGSALGLILVSTTTGASTATDTLTLGSLIDAEAETSYLARCYAMPISTASANAGQVRRIRKDGFTAATGVTRTVGAYSTTTSSAVEVEIYAPLPPKDADGRIGLNTICNRVLSECWDIDTLSITPSAASQSTYSLATVADWVRDDDQIVDVWYRRSGSTTDEIVPEWRLVHDLDTKEIEIRGAALSTGDALKIEVYRPLNTWIEVNSTWAASTSGLQNDSDRCLLSEEGFEVIGRAHALALLATVGDFEGKRIDEAKATDAREAANAWKNSLPRKQGRPVHWSRTRVVGTGGTWPREGSLG
jgi:hypothetical protein